MGDRISVSFAKNDEESVVLFHHWGGIEFKKTVERYVSERLAHREGQMMPLDRREPQTVMVDFISWLTKGEAVESSLYLGRTKEDGDNSDTGHWTYDLEKEKWIEVKGK